MSLRNKLSAATQGLDLAAPVPAPSKTGPRTAPGQMFAFSEQMRELNDELEETRKQLQEALNKVATAELLITDLVEVPGRKRRLTAEEFEELKANLRNNPLASSITVRRLDNGKYEIIAGHNRVEAYRQLGRDRIRADILEVTDDEAERTSFYSNLLSVTLTDYEKYVGLRARQKARGLTQEQLSAESGIPRGSIAALFSFESLPAGALEVLAAAPEKLGVAAAVKLAGLAKAGKGAQVVEAIKKVVEGVLTQDAAVRAVSASATSTPARPEPKVIKRGKKTFCKVLHHGKDIRISFTDQDQAQAVVAAVLELLDAHANGGA